MGIGNPKRTFKFLTSESGARSILDRNANKVFGLGSQVRGVSIKILKTYLDDSSFSLQALYTVTAEDKAGKLMEKQVFASAHSSGNKRRDYEIGKHMMEHFRLQPVEALAVPNVYAFVPEYGMFLRQYIDGPRVKDILQDRRRLDKGTAALIAHAVSELHAMDVSGLGTALDARSNTVDLEKNLDILRERSSQEFRPLKKCYRELQDRLQDLESGLKENRVLCHGDFNPSNIILTADGRASLIDFGSASFQHPLWDIAAFYSHVSTMQDLALNAGQRKKAAQALLDAYQSRNGRLSIGQKQLFTAYRDYFELLADSHVAVWG